MTTESAPYTTASRVVADAITPAPRSSPEGRKPTEGPRGVGFTRSARSRAKSILKHAVLIATAVVMIYPLLWMVVSSFRPSEEVFRAPGLWLTEAHLQNYANGRNALTSPFSTYLINSAIGVQGAVVGNLLPVPVDH